MNRLVFLLTFGLIGVAILVGLGVWQVQRLAWKERMLAQIETRIAADPVPVPQSPDPEKARFLPVLAEGMLEAQDLHVLVSMKRVGAGYRIISPLVLPDGRRILVDRGFTPVDAKEAPREDGPIQVTGNLHWPDEVDGFTPDPDPAKNIWYARDVPAMAAALGTEPVLLIARQMSPPDQGVTPLPVDTNGIPNNHLQYAITWFGLAGIWALMTFYFLLSRGRGSAKG